MDILPLHVIVKFGADFPVEHRGLALFLWERSLRAQTGLRIEVFQEKKGDDSRLRNAMTAEQRAKL
jgi:hypothetical protein